jgi:hypothetical protein
MKKPRSRNGVLEVRSPNPRANTVVQNVGYAAPQFGEFWMKATDIRP